LALGWHGLTHHPHPLWAAPLFGFACGGLMHLLVVAAAWGGTLWLVQSAWTRAPLLQHWLGWLHRV
ncbi:metal-dependent hydrolase, partial [Burkholderia multivorans]